MKPKKDHVLLGASFIFLAAIAYAVMGALVKLGKQIPDEQLVFFRNFVCFILILPFVLFPKPKELKTFAFKTHFVRALAGLLNMYCFFFSIRYIILTDAMLLNNTMPLFVPLVMWVWKGVKIPLKLIPGLILGFIGIIVILKPGLSIFQPASFLALASGLFMSISMAGIRELGKFEPLFRILFYYFAISTGFSAILAFWRWEHLTPLFWLILFGVGFFAALYQFFLTKGYQYAPATKISAVIYFAVILSGLFDWLIWKIVPSAYSFIGVILVIIGAIICLNVEAKET